MKFLHLFSINAVWISFTFSLIGAQVWAQTEQSNTASESVAQVVPLEMSFAATSASYEIHEPIRFEVTGNQLFYLYLFSEDLSTGERKMLFPNARQSENLIEPGLVSVVPEASVSFTRDKPGTERITAIGSLEYIELAMPPLSSSNGRASGQIGLSVDTLVEKGMQIKEDDKVSNVSIVSTEVTITKAEVLRVEADVEEPVALIKTSCAQCVEGEPLAIAYGVTQPGYVLIVVSGPDGMYAELMRDEVDGVKMKTARVVAEKPVGLHNIGLLYSETPFGNSEKQLETINWDIANSLKGLRPQDEDKASLIQDSYQFEVLVQ